MPEFKPYEIELAIGLIDPTQTKPIDQFADVPGNRIYDPFEYEVQQQGGKRRSGQFLVRLMPVKIDSAARAEEISRAKIPKWRIQPAFRQVIEDEGDERFFEEAGLRCMIHRNFHDGVLMGCVEVPETHRAFRDFGNGSVCGHPNCSLHDSRQMIPSAGMIDTDHFYEGTIRIPRMACHQVGAFSAISVLEPVLCRSDGRYSQPFSGAEYMSMATMVRLTKELAHEIAEFDLNAFLARKEE